MNKQSNLSPENEQSGIIIPGQVPLYGEKKKISLRQLWRMQEATINQLKAASVRAQLLACELYRVDSKNDIFKMTEGVLDKKHLFYVKSALDDGSYDRNRDLARLKT